MACPLGAQILFEGGREETITYAQGPGRAGLRWVTGKGCAGGLLCREVWNMLPRGGARPWGPPAAECF